MPARLVIQRPGEPPTAMALAERVSVGGGGRDAIAAPGAPPGALVLWPAGDRIAVEARAAGAVLSGSPLPVGARRLLRDAERVELARVSLWPEPAPADSTRALAGALLAGLAPPEPPAGPRLVVVAGPACGDVLPLRDGAVLGRGTGADLLLDDPLASRRHARFALRGDAISVRDLASKNGVTVNGRRLRRRPTRLGGGDALSLGDSVLVLEGVAEATAVRPAPESTGRAAHARALRAGRPGRLALGAAGALLAGAAAALCAVAAG